MRNKKIAARRTRQFMARENTSFASSLPARLSNPLPAVRHISAEIEIRQVFEAEDFGPEFTSELREQEERVREQIAGKR